MNDASQIPVLQFPLRLVDPEGRRAAATPALLEGLQMGRHTSMPPRIQKTPHGDVSLTSRWQHDRYYLAATGAADALLWLFPKHEGPMEKHGPSFRHMFAPAPTAVTIERELRRVCSKWQDRWNERISDHLAGISATPETQRAPAIATLGQLFDHLYQERTATVAKSTTSRDRYRLQVWRAALGNSTPLLSLSPELIGVALAKIGKLTSPATANSAFGVLKTYLNWAHNMGLTKDRSHATVRRLKEPPGERHHRLWWTADEVAQAIQIAGRDEHQPTATLLVACGCYLGLRVEEIIMLRWQDFSLDRVNPKTNEPSPVCHLTPHDGWQPKDGEARDIPICAALLTILKQHRRAEGYLLQAEEGRPGRPRDGKGWIYRYDPKKVWARVIKEVVKAGGKAITMYGMRHSFASNFLIAGVSDVKVSRWLGHADTRMIHRHYGHLLSYDDDINAVGRTHEHE